MMGEEEEEDGEVGEARSPVKAEGKGLLIKHGSSRPLERVGRLKLELRCIPGKLDEAPESMPEGPAL